MKAEEIKKMFRDEAFLQELQQVDSMESLQRFLASKGVQMSLEQMDRAIHTAPEAELSENDLCAVSGGGLLSWISFAFRCFMFCPMEVQ